MQNKRKNPTVLIMTSNEVDYLPNVRTYLFDCLPNVGTNKF